MSRWFRMHDELLDDPKVQRLPADDFRGWVNLLCLASRNEGRLPAVADIAFALRETENAVSTLLERLLNGGLIECRNGGPNGKHYAPYKWSERQYKSDTSTDRVKRFRKRSETVAETPPETEAETERISSSEDRPSDDGPTLKPEHVFESYQELAQSLGLPVPRDFTPERRQLVKGRVRQYALDDFQTVFTKARESPFLRGDRGRSPLSFDWLMQKRNFQKTLEGNYER